MTTDPNPNTRKPALIAFDATLWAGEAEPESLGVAFAHKDGHGFDVLLDGVPLSGRLTLRAPNAAPATPAPAGGVPAKRPDHKAYLVTDRKDKNGKARWKLVGYAYRQDDGAGYDLLFRTLPVNGRLSLRLNDA